MYITYEPHQYCLEEDIGGSCSGPSLHPNTSFTTQHPRSGPVVVPEFKPTWLIRTSDMEKIRGSDIQEPYYALSYSWNQSGDIFQDDGGKKYTRIDNGKHEIIISPERKIRVPREKGIKIIPASTRLVTFEGLIQQICQDFNIRYIWYDQKCIDQDNPDEKRREIQQMHKIYSNAQCTVVLIPEFHITKRNSLNLGNLEVIATSEWSKRIWTFEEAIMSKRLLFVGRDVHLWSYIHDRNHGDKETYSYTSEHAFLYDICTKPAKMSVSAVLWHARRRTSSKLHDRVFALANLFPEVTTDLSFNYNQPLLDAMLQFYGLLAQYDLSILCFGVPQIGEGQEDVHIRLQEDELLPSWTGASGSHATRLIPSEHTFDVSAIDFKVNERLLHLTCDCIHVSIEKRYYERSNPFIYYEEAAGTASLPHTSPYDRSSLVFIEETSPYSQLPAGIVGLKHTHFLPFAKDDNSDAWINTTLNPVNIQSVVLSLTDTSCKECIILSELDYFYNEPVTGSYITVMPVIRCGNEGNYHCIGTCIVDSTYFHFNRLAYPNLKKRQTFTIQ